MRFVLRFFGLVMAVVFLTACGISAVARHSAPAASDAPTLDADATGERRVTRILVMGCDRAASLCDTMFILSLDETDSRAAILQIPRDTYADYTDRDYKKINGALGVLGADALKKTLGEALGVRIDAYAVLDLDCLRRAVDSIDGIDLIIPQDMHYSDPDGNLAIHFAAGQAHLDGKQAEEFVRYRSGYANADLGRLDAQKLFMRAFAQKCQALNAGQMMRLVGAVIADLQTDLTLPQAIRLSSCLSRVDLEQLPMATLAGSALQGSSGAWYYAINRAGACRMANDYLMPDAPISVDRFDPNGFFDRVENPDFHNIYIAPDGG